MGNSIAGSALTELLGIRYPILQAPMAGASNPDLVAAVSNAGGLGALGAAALSPDALGRAIDAIRQQTDAPFNINLFARATEYQGVDVQPGPQFRALLEDFHSEQALGPLPDPGPLFGPVDEQLAVLIEAQVPVVSIHFGVEADIVARCKAANMTVLCSATTVAEATALADLGVDVIIAQGAEAGGHRGTFLPADGTPLIGTLALVPQIVDAVSVPVIAAGGIMEARGISAAMALGAAGVQMGTAFLACPETGLNTAWRDRLLSATAADTTVTTAVSGKPARGIRNRYIDAVESLTEPTLPYPLHYAMSGPLRARALQTDNPDFIPMWSGQGVGQIRVAGAATLIADWVRELAWDQAADSA